MVKIGQVYRDKDKRTRKPKTDLDRCRTRWRRWLGNKCSAGRPYWTTLLNANWVGWVARVYDDCALGTTGINFTTPQDELKAIYSKAIDHATMQHLIKLDALYAENRWADH